MHHPSCLPPKGNCFVKELNQIIFKSLWKGQDKVTRLSVINKHEEGGLKIIDKDSMIMYLRLA